MAPSLSKYVTKKTVFGAASVSVILWLLTRRKNQSKTKARRPPHMDIQYMIGDKSQSKTKAQVDAIFFKQIRHILGIAIKGVLTPEAGFLLLVAGSLVARSLCDIWMIQNHTSTENAIVTMDKSRFRKHLLEFLIAMPVISLVNNVLKWGIGEIKLRLRTRLTHYLYDEYLKGFTYYKMSNLDTRIANADQLLTTDVDRFCDSFADLYSNICKPLLDIFIYVYQLTANVGGATPGLMMVYLVFAGMFLTYLRRPAGRMTVQEQKLEGEFRYINSRLIANSEEVAFYMGNNREKLTLLAAFQKLTDHMRHFLEFRVLMGTVDNLVAKCVESVSMLGRTSLLEKLDGE